jgi:RNA polymerase subunit RPABC4/transcription elongation factor Spt4
MTTCPECGATTADSATNCPSCGASFANAEAGPPVNCDHCDELIASDSEACPACGSLRESRPCAQHSDKQAEGICVICGTALCDDCNRAGDSYFICETHKEIPVVGGWAQVYTTSDDLEADLIRENLEAEGIDSRVLSQKDHFSLPVDLGDLSPVRVLVPAYDYEAAGDVLAEHRNAQGEVAFGDGEEPAVT